MAPVVIALKPAVTDASSAGLIPKEITTSIEATGGREAETRVPLPSSVGLLNIKEVVLTYEHGGETSPHDLSVTRLEFLASPEAASREKSGASVPSQKSVR
jgi:hypothetical protein